MSAKLQLLQQMVRGEVPPPPIAILLGLTLDSVEVGRVTMGFEAKAEHANPMGTLHGGILCDLADAAMGFAFVSTLDDDESFTTLELKINFLRPVWSGPLRAVGYVVKRGRTVGLAECDVTDERSQLVARATSTCMVLRGEQARGR